MTDKTQELLPVTPELLAMAREIAANHIGWDTYEDAAAHNHHTEDFVQVALAAIYETHRRAHSHLDREAAKEVAIRISEEMFSHPDDQLERDIAYGAAFAGIVETANASRISHPLPGDVGRSEWMNLMPREVVARAALGEGCRDETADNIRYGFHRDVKIRAEVAVKLVASIQDDVRAALTPSPCPRDGMHPDIEGHIADAVRDACNWTLGKVISFDESRGIAATIADRIKIANAEYRAAHQGAGEP